MINTFTRVELLVIKNYLKMVKVCRVSIHFKLQLFIPDYTE